MAHLVNTFALSDFHPVCEAMNTLIISSAKRGNPAKRGALSITLNST